MHSLDRSLSTASCAPSCSLFGTLGMHETTTRSWCLQITDRYNQPSTVILPAEFINRCLSTYHCGQAMSLSIHLYRYCTIMHNPAFFPSKSKHQSRRNFTNPSDKHLNRPFSPGLQFRTLDHSIYRNTENIYLRRISMTCKDGGASSLPLPNIYCVVQPRSTVSDGFHKVVNCRFP